MGEKTSNNFVQQVFDEISLETNMELWMSSDDSLLQDRLEFLACYPQTMFTEQLFNMEKRTNLAKNLLLCKGFMAKAKKCVEKQDWKQALNLFNMSLTLAPLEEVETKLVLDVQGFHIKPNQMLIFKSKNHFEKKFFK